MPAEFQVVNERVILNKYTEPLRSADIDHMAAELLAYTEQAPQTVFTIVDVTEVKNFPAYILTTGLRQANINPMRNPKIERIFVIAYSPFLASLASAVSSITRIEKIVLVRNRAEADREIEALIKNG
jgi:hypothetical protein